MKRAILLLTALTVLAVSSTAYPWGSMWVQPSGGGGGTVDNCPDATYDFAWTGENTSANTTACVANGASTVNVGTNNDVLFGSSYGEGTGDGAQISASGDNVCWTIDEAAILGTVWFSINTRVTTTSNGAVVMMHDGTVYANLTVESDLTYRSYYSSEHADSASTIPAQTWTRMGLSYKSTTTEGLTTWSLVGGDWDTDEDADNITPGNNWNRICIGNPLISGTYNREAWIDNIYFVNGTYKAADPKP